MQPFVIKGCIQIGWVYCKRAENRGFRQFLKQETIMGQKTEKIFLPWG